MKFLPRLSLARISLSYSSLVALAGLFGSLYAPTLTAQTVTFIGKAPSVDFGSANVCKPGQTDPAPCSQTLTLDYKVTAAGTLGTPKVLTMGVPNLDFTLANGATCIGGVTTGETCAVNVTFAPRFPGGRPGAVQIVSAGGKVLATTPILGTGDGPLIGTLTGGVITTNSFPNQQAYDSVSAAPLVDGAGNVFVALDNFNGGPTPTAAAVFELPAGGGPPVPGPFDFAGTSGPNIESNPGQELAEDGAGDLFALASALAPPHKSVLLELPAGGAPQMTFTFSTTTLTAVAADGVGDLFLLDQPTAAGTTSQILKLPSGCQSVACVVTVVAQDNIVGMSVDVAGDVFFTYYNQGVVGSTELPANGGAPIALGSAYQLGTFDALGDAFRFTSEYIGDNNNDLIIEETPLGSLTPINLATAATYEYVGYPDGSSWALTANLIGDVFVAFTPNSAPSQALITYYRSKFAPLNFGSLPSGASKTLPLAVTNTGNKNLIISPYLEGPSYKILSQLPTNCLEGIDPGHTCTVNIQFTALSEGPHTVNLTLASNGVADATILLQGIGTGPAPFIDFGSANLCKPGQAESSPCSKTLTVHYKVTEDGTLGTPKVRTLGSPNLDFTLADGTTCTGAVTKGEICAVNVRFAPRFPGIRPGGVLIIDDQGKTLATTFIYGNGNGPQIGFTSGTVIPAGEVLAVDGAGDQIVLVDKELQRVPVNGGPVTKINIKPFISYGGVAIDGVGNLYVLTDSGTVTEVPQSGFPWIELPITFEESQYGALSTVSVDKFGDALVTTGGFNVTPTVLNFAPGATSPVITYPNPDLNLYPTDFAGNLFARYGNDAVVYPAGSNTLKILPFSLPFPDDWSQVGADFVGNIFLSDYIVDVHIHDNGYFQSSLLELPLGAGPQITVPAPSYAENFLAAANGDLFVSGFEYITSGGGPNTAPFLTGKVERSVASPLNFGSLPIGSSKTLPLGITNTGNQPLVLSPCYESPSYKLSQSPAGCVKSIAPGAVCTLNVQFTALTEGDHTITLTLGSNGTADATIQLQGIGTK